MRLFARVEAGGCRERGVQREHAVELRTARTFVGQRAARGGEGGIAGRRDDPEPVGCAALDDEDEAFRRARGGIGKAGQRARSGDGDSRQYDRTA